jgi:hypothetical protein
MKPLLLLVGFSVMLGAATVARADLDRCPDKQREFQGQVAAADDAWNNLNAKVSAAQFPREAFLIAYRKHLEEEALHNLEDLITGYNSTALPKNKIPPVSKANLQLAAKNTVDLELARPEVKQVRAYAMQQAEDYFFQKRAAKLVELANRKKDMDDKFNNVHGQLNASCTYDFPSQTVRIAQGALDEAAKLENGVLQFLTANLPLKAKDGQLWDGDHPVLDLPVVTTSGVSIGGTNIALVPTFSGGALQIPVLPGVPGVPPLNIKLPDVSCCSGPGLGVHIGGISF